MGKEDFYRSIELFQFTGDLESLRHAFPYALEKYGDIKDAWAVQLHKPPSFYMDMLDDEDKKNWSNYHKLFDQDLSPTLIFLPNPDKSGNHLAILLDRQEDSSGNIDLNSPITIADYPPNRIYSQLDELLKGEGGTLSNGADQDIEYLDVHLLPLSSEQEDQYIGHDACSNQNEYSLTAEDSQEMIRTILGLANFENNPNKDKLLVPEKDRVDPASYQVLMQARKELDNIQDTKWKAAFLLAFSLIPLIGSFTPDINHVLQAFAGITGGAGTTLGLFLTGHYFATLIKNSNILENRGK